jgi:hypothetical protein
MAVCKYFLRGLRRGETKTKRQRENRRFMEEKKKIVSGGIGKMSKMGEK